MNVFINRVKPLLFVNNKITEDLGHQTGLSANNKIKSQATSSVVSTWIVDSPPRKTMLPEDPTPRLCENRQKSTRCDRAYEC